MKFILNYSLMQHKKIDNNLWKYEIHLNFLTMTPYDFL